MGQNCLVRQGPHKWANGVSVPLLTRAQLQEIGRMYDPNDIFDSVKLESWINGNYEPEELFALEELEPAVERETERLDRLKKEHNKNRAYQSKTGR